MAVSTPASSSQVQSGNYDVFISFRGPDVRYGFLSHLEKELRRKNIDVYVDDRLERGEEISSSLVKAIEGSMIALVIFSKDYASSRWCLEELVKIMEHKEADQQIVIPVFYHVDPSDVRHQRHAYVEAFTFHEEKFKDKVKIWRFVLEKSANLSGYHSSQFQNESKLIDAIVEDVWKKLKEKRPIEPKPHPIRFHQNFTSIELLMEIKSQEVRILGIWGMGGIGKTTLARAIFEKFLSEFESHCFLENVREKSTRVDGLNSLCDELLYRLSGQKDQIDKEDVKRRLQNKKVLIVLDDVDNAEQLKYLVGQHLLLGQGSRIIITGRNKHVLRSGGILDKYIHEVNVLNFKESLELFSMHAFNQIHPKMEYEELSKMTVAIAEGLPLALEVLGSHFRSRDEAYWESELNKLKKYPHEKIKNILKISYDGLNYMDKEIFLDIAFFFVGEKKDKITSVLKACGFEAISGMKNLMDKALIKSNCNDQIVMHDLIQDMAEQIVREECMRHPERRSRLKDTDEICDILESNMGTGEIEGIILNASQRKYPQLMADFFIKMKKLRIIKLLASIELPFGLDSFPYKLRYLHWNYYPLESLPSGSYFENLVELHMENSNVKKLWDGKQDLANLKKINLRWSKKLIELPDLSMARVLEIVNLYECENLRSVHPSILSLHSIVEIDVSYCGKLESLESETHLESLTHLRVDFCYSLQKFCLSSKKLSYIHLYESRVEILRFPTGHFTELKELKLVGERLRSLPIDVMCGLTNLEVFKVPNFKQDIETMELHSLFNAWRNLRELCLEGWSNLLEIPDNIKGLTKLEYLSLDDTSVETLPACINHLSSLTWITLIGCKRLKYILGLPPSLVRLDATYCTSLETLPAFVNNISSLRRLTLTGCKRLKSILGLPPSLVILDASDCTSLENVSSNSLLRNRCDFCFHNCVMLNKSSLCFIQELTHSSVTLAYNDDLEYDGGGVVCYPGSRVPNWMKYRPMPNSSNVIKFTCNPERSLAIVFCCVAPLDLISNKLVGPFCRISCGDNHKVFSAYPDEYDDGYYEMNMEHVFLWLKEGWDLLNGIGTVNDVQISCEFSLSYYSDDKKEQYPIVVPAKACGVHLIYFSESEAGGKRLRDSSVEGGSSPKKQLKNYDHDDLICHPLQLKFLGRAKQKDLSLIHFL